jgi:protein gp37
VELTRQQLYEKGGRLAQFARWLNERGRAWPENLVAMTSVLDARMAKSAIKCLQQVAAPIRGLSVEPLHEAVTLDLAGIDWVIVGGESSHYARPFHLEWARILRDQCRRQGVAFIVK